MHHGYLSFYSRETFVVYALPTASVPNKTYVQLGVSLARNSEIGTNGVTATYHPKGYFATRYAR